MWNNDSFFLVNIPFFPFSSLLQYPCYAFTLFPFHLISPSFSSPLFLPFSSNFRSDLSLWLSNIILSKEVKDACIKRLHGLTFTHSNYNAQINFIVGFEHRTRFLKMEIIISSHASKPILQITSVADLFHYLLSPKHAAPALCVMPTSSTRSRDVTAAHGPQPRIHLQ